MVCVPAVNVNTPASLKPFNKVKVPVAMTRTPGVIATVDPGIVTLLEEVLTSNVNVMPLVTDRSSAPAGPVV